MIILNKSYSVIILSLLLTLFSACKKDISQVNFTSQNGTNSDEVVSTLQNIDISNGELGVVELPITVASNIRTEFKWYTKITAPNGKPIHFLAQDGWTIEKVAYTRTVMEHYLTNVQNIVFGKKDAVANKIGNNNSAMTMYNTEVGTNRSVTGQDLQANETVAIGSPEYLDLSVRNAALEEILHFVHDYGLTPVYSGFQSMLSDATVNAMNNQLFIPWSMLPVADYDNELLAAYNDAYWGTMEHRENNTPYLFKSREACSSGDPLTTSLMNSFQTEYFASILYISASFSGTFFLTKQSDLPYTNQSQYYKDMQLLGANHTNLIGNRYHNNFIGNTGNNEFTGYKGNDIIDGNEGVDKAIYSGNYSQYTINTQNGITTISDNVQHRDGIDILSNIEHVQFSDQTIDL